MMTAAELTSIVMKEFVAAAFDCGNLGSLFGCSYPELAEGLPLNEYCLLGPFDETFQDVNNQIMNQGYPIALENYCCTLQDAYQDAPFAVDPSLYQDVGRGGHLIPCLNSYYPLFQS
jgi:hypothetical protein